MGRVKVSQPVDVFFYQDWGSSAESKGAEGGHNFNYHLYQFSIAALQITPELSKTTIYLCARGCWGLGIQTGTQQGWLVPALRCLGSQLEDLKAGAGTISSLIYS